MGMTNHNPQSAKINSANFLKGQSAKKLSLENLALYSMLFKYAQIVPIIMTKGNAPTLPIMLKLCPLFLEGAELYVQII